MSIGFVSLVAAGIYLFTRDAFTYTHYPIRFNRKNRQVYVFRLNGTVLKADGRTSIGRSSGMGSVCTICMWSGM